MAARLNRRANRDNVPWEGRMTESDKRKAGPDVGADGALAGPIRDANGGEVAAIDQKMCERCRQLGAYAETDVHR